VDAYFYRNFVDGWSDGRSWSEAITGMAKTAPTTNAPLLAELGPMVNGPV
jgi:hypothetical protein